jgi:hypothetical protein
VKNERGDEQIDVELYQSREIETAASVQEPSEGEYHEYGQKNFDKNFPEKHADRL